MIEDHASRTLSCNCMVGFNTLRSSCWPSSAIRFNHIVTSTEISRNWYISDDRNISSTDVVIWSALNRLLNSLRYDLDHIGYLVYLLQRITW